MARWGQAWTVGWGDPENFFQPVPKRALFEEVAGGVRARFICPDNRAGFVRIVADGVPQQIKYATPGEETDMAAQWQRDGLVHGVSLVPQGGWATPLLDVTGQFEAFEAARRDRFSVVISPRPSINLYREAGGTIPFSNLVLQRLRRFKNVSPVAGRPTIGKLKMEVKTVTETLAAGTVTNHYVGCYDEHDTLICFGYTAEDSATVKLIPMFGYDVYGSVDLDWSGDVEDEATWPAADANDVVVLVRWSAKYLMDYGGSLDLPAFEWPTTNISAVIASNVLTVTTDVDHYYHAGDSVAILFESDFDGTYTIASAPTARTFTIALVHANASAGGGTATPVSMTLSAAATGIPVAAGYTFLNSFYIQIDNEVILVTAVAGGVATVTRAQRGTAAASHADTAVAAAARSYQAEVPDTGTFVYGFTSPALAAGTYHIDCQQEDECGNRSPGDIDITVAVISVPDAPTALTYVSGGYAATIVNFVSAAATGKTWHLYDSLETEQLVYESPTSCSTDGNKVLAAIGATFTGWRLVAVRSVLGGVEDGNASILQIEYDNGAVVGIRPPAPQASLGYSTVGRTLTVPVTIDPFDAAGVAATLQLFIFKLEDGPDYTSPDSTAVVDTTQGTTLIHQSIAGGKIVDGVFFFAVRTITAGGVQSDNTDYYGPVVLTINAPADPALSLVGA